MIEGKFISGDADLKEARAIRKEVFVEEQGIPEELEFDSLDQEAVHVVVYDSGRPAATGRVIIKDGEFLIGRIAVLKKERGKKLGDFVVRLLADRAFTSGADRVLVHAQQGARGFYEKIGFRPVGKEFMEACIPHIPMELKKEYLCTGCESLKPVTKQ